MASDGPEGIHFRFYANIVWHSTEIDAEIASEESLLSGTTSPLFPHLSQGETGRGILVSLSWVFSFSILSERLTPSSSLWPHQLQVQVQGMRPTLPSQPLLSFLLCPSPALSAPPHPTLPLPPLPSIHPFTGHPQHMIPCCRRGWLNLICWSEENWAQFFFFSVLFQFSYSHTASTHTCTHTHNTSLSESSTTKTKKMDYSGLINCSCIISPACHSLCLLWFICVFLFFLFFLSCDSKCEELAGLLQYLVNVYMSAGKRDGGRSKDESVGVGCSENREIMLLGGHSVGRAGKKMLHC